MGEVRCYCNQPECVPQGYMCRGRSCFTKLPSNANAPLSRAEHTPHSGCLDDSFKSRQCPAGFLCCDQDLCNHVDNPALKNRLNKTLRGSTFDVRLFYPSSRMLKKNILDIPLVTSVTLIIVMFVRRLDIAINY